MDLEEKRDRLYSVASSDPDPARRAKARELLATLPTKSADTGQRPERHAEQPVADPVSIETQPVPSTAGDVIGSVSRLGMSPETDNAVVEGMARLANGATGGLFDATLDTAAEAAGKPRAFRERREAFQAAHPIAANALSVGGGFAPGSVPSRIGGAVNRGISSAVAGLSPRLQALIGPSMQKLVSGATAGSAIGAMQGGLAAEPGEHAAGAGRGALAGAAVGGGLGLASAGAGKLADALTNDDIALLDKYGLRPSMVPGTPITRKGSSVSENISNPPLGTHTAGPASRQQAGIQAAQTILPDLLARAKASSSQLAGERAGNVTSGVASRPVPYDPAVAEAETLMSEPGTLPAVKSSINTVAKDLTERAVPKVRIAGSMLPIRGATLPAEDLQRIAAMSHDLAEPEAYGSPGKPKLKLLGGRLHSQLPPEMIDQDARYAASAKAMERARESLSLEHGDIKNPDGEVPLAAIRKAGNLIGRGGENTKAAETADLGVSRLREDGPPEVMKGPGGGTSPHAPDQVDYSSAIDQPALHVAQENLQLNPSAVFSGGGNHGIIHRLGGAGARRLIYPGARAAGEGNTGRVSGPALTLWDALRLQLKQDEDVAEEKP